MKRQTKKGSASASRRQDGFTLIELLVVIAIIGMLAGIVLASLNTARNKGSDAAIKGNLAGMRVQTEVYYDSNNNYGGTTFAAAEATSAGAADGPCATASTVFDTAASPSINSAIIAAAKASGGKAKCSAGAVIASGPVTSWAVSAPCKQTDCGFGGSTGTWCVDSTGTSKPGVASGGCIPTSCTTTSAAKCQ